MKVNVCEVSSLFELPELYPLERQDDIELLECIATRWNSINNPTLMQFLNQRVQCRRPRYIEEEIVSSDFSLEYDFSETYPIDVGSIAVAYLEDVEFAGIVRDLSDEWIEIEYFDTGVSEIDTIEVSIHCVEVILP